MNARPNAIRYYYAGPFKTFERAQDVLDDMWAFGEVGPLEEPLIESCSCRRGRPRHYVITLLG